MNMAMLCSLYYALCVDSLLMLMGDMPACMQISQGMCLSAAHADV